jgi:hypothetical protein
MSNIKDSVRTVIGKGFRREFQGNFDGQIYNITFAIKADSNKNIIKKIIQNIIIMML